MTTRSLSTVLDITVHRFRRETAHRSTGGCNKPLAGAACPEDHAHEACN
jgi:hypothetical protein